MKSVHGEYSTGRRPVQNSFHHYKSRIIENVRNIMCYSALSECFPGKKCMSLGKNCSEVFIKKDRS